MGETEGVVQRMQMASGGIVETRAITRAYDLARECPPLQQFEMGFAKITRQQLGQGRQ